MQIIDGTKIQKEILSDIKEKVSKLGFQPVFCDVLVGDDPASRQYVKIKMRMAEEVGILPHPVFFGSDITTEELIKEIGALNKIPNMCGIIIQLPLPPSIDRRAVLDAIDPRLDVDCLGTEKGESFYKGESDSGLPTGLACMAVLDSLALDLHSKNIVVLGQGELMGKPVAALLRFRGINPVVIDSKTENPQSAIEQADVIISGIGQANYITGDMVKRGVVLIDAGTSEDGTAVVGDIDSVSVAGVASFLSPVPGGVGPVTVAMLLKNVLAVAENLKN